MNFKKPFQYILLLILVTSCGDGTGSKQSSDTVSGLQIVSGNLQEAIAGHPIQNPLVVKAVDTNGKPVAGQTVEFSIPATSEANAIFSPVTTTTNADGLAQTSVQLGKNSGKVTLQALWLRNNEPQIAVATFTSAPDAPVQIIVVSGDNQCQESGQVFKKLVVKVADQFGNGVPVQQVQVDVSRASIVTPNGNVPTSIFDTDEKGIVEIKFVAGELNTGEFLISAPYPVNLHLVSSTFTKTVSFENSWPPTILFSPSTPLQTSSTATSYNITIYSYDVCGVARTNKLLQLFVNNVYKKYVVTDSIARATTTFTNADFPDINVANSFIQAYDFEVSGQGALFVKHY